MWFLEVGVYGRKGFIGSDSCLIFDFFLFYFNESKTIVFAFFTLKNCLFFAFEYLMFEAFVNIQIYDDPFLDQHIFVLGNSL